MVFFVGIGGKLDKLTWLSPMLQFLSLDIYVQSNIVKIYFALSLYWRDKNIDTMRHRNFSSQGQWPNTLIIVTKIHCLQLELWETSLSILIYQAVHNITLKNPILVETNLFRFVSNNVINNTKTQISCTNFHTSITANISRSEGDLHIIVKGKCITN